jgi:hypothetical protein
MSFAAHRQVTRPAEFVFAGDAPPRGVSAGGRDIHRFGGQRPQWINCTVK